MKHVKKATNIVNRALAVHLVAIQQLETANNVLRAGVEKTEKEIRSIEIEVTELLDRGDELHKHIEEVDNIIRTNEKLIQKYKELTE